MVVMAQAPTETTMSDVFTPGQAVKLTGIPGSILRRYVKVFPDYLSNSARRKRGREFSERDVLVLVQIRDLFKDGISQDDVIAKIGEIAETIPEQISANEETPPTALMVLNRIAERQVSQQEQIDDLRNQLIQMAEEAKKPFWKRWK